VPLGVRAGWPLPPPERNWLSVPHSAGELESWPLLLFPAEGAQAARKLPALVSSPGKWGYMSPSCKAVGGVRLPFCTGLPQRLLPSCLAEGGSY
jgi:hypothetical protein